MCLSLHVNEAFSAQITIIIHKRVFRVAVNTYVPIFRGIDDVVAENYEQTRRTTTVYHITIIIHYNSCKTSIIITVAALFPSILVTCKLSASCESVDSTYTIRLFLHTVTVRSFEALKLNRYNVTSAKPLNIKQNRSTLSTCANLE